jgi:hypothetical protein
MATLSDRCQICRQALEETQLLIDRYSDLDEIYIEQLYLAEARENLTTLIAVLHGANAVLKNYLKDF